MTSLHLGASLYVPATRPDILAVANGARYPSLRSAILCTEDSILPGQIDEGIDNLGRTLPFITQDRPYLFIRPRDLQTLKRILALPGINNIDGFVLPKTTAQSLEAYAAAIPQPFVLMPTLETREVFAPSEMAYLRGVLLQPNIQNRILALRIGGNDLLNLIGVRRRLGQTLYSTALGPVISALVTTFRPYGFALTAPVFDDFGDPATLEEEVLSDLDHGLIGKTAIHPAQIARIENLYRVSQSELDAARAILKKSAPAVFQLEKVMCEPATHSAWAQTIIQRAETYGIETKPTLLRWPCE